MPSIAAPRVVIQSKASAAGTVEVGSSVSHWDTIAFPNQLMEPAINGDLTHSVVPPNDLTFKLLRDLGW
jgi:predicted lysophospholipase L1 biosynthesis ABC-type transport system permease subunit